MSKRARPRLEFPEKHDHPCWNSWDECLNPARRMTASLEQLVPNIYQLKAHLESVIHYAMVLERQLDYLYQVAEVYPGWFDAARLDAIRAVLQERVPEIVLHEAWAEPEREDEDFSERHEAASPGRS